MGLRIVLVAVAAASLIGCSKDTLPESESVGSAMQKQGVKAGPAESRAGQFKESTVPKAGN